MQTANVVKDVLHTNWRLRAQTLVVRRDYMLEHCYLLTSRECEHFSRHICTLQSEAAAACAPCKGAKSALMYSTSCWHAYFMQCAARPPFTLSGLTDVDAHKIIELTRSHRSSLRCQGIPSAQPEHVSSACTACDGVVNSSARLTYVPATSMIQRGRGKGELQR